ncbi:MAG: hypothetical protein IKP73_08295 [Bacteroidales bacterium]|nr:hypothetical protein [Bacteroidales bacterium]
MEDKNTKQISIDLGLPSGTLWADRNIGASTPEDFGDYFAWGEVNPKNTEYSWETYEYKKSPKNLPELCDAAAENLGTDWRIPTYEQFEELKTNCKDVWTGKGYSFESKINGKTLFLPAAGYVGFASYSWFVGEGGYYWSSSIDEDNNARAMYLLFYSGGAITGSHSRCVGYPIRAVRCK